MKKKFKRLVEKETAAKVKRRRIMSAFLAAFMFVSGGSFGNLAEVGFTASAEEENIVSDEPNLENVSEQTGEDNGGGETTVDDGESSDGEDESHEDVDDPNNGDGEPADGEDETIVEDEEINDNAEENEGIALLADDGESDFQPVIKIVPQINEVPSLEKDHVKDPANWETNATYNSADNAYILRGSDSVEIFGVTKNFKQFDHNPNGDEKAPYSNVYNLGDDIYIATDANIWIADKKYGAYGESWGTQRDLLSRADEVKYKINANGLLEVSTTINSNIPPVDDDGNATIINAWAVFNNGLANNSDNSWQELYISARPKESFIQVYSKVGDRDMNEVNEYVYDANITPQQKLNVSGEYKDGQIDLNSLCILNNYDTPYLLHPDEAIYIKGVGKNPIDATNSSLDSDANCKLTHGTGPVAGVDDYTQFIVTGNGDRYCLTYDTGYTDQNGDAVYEKFYIWNYNRWLDYYDHADIEIADKNTYTIETMVNDGTVENPVYRKYKVVYDVYVSDVDYSQIFKADNTPVVLKDQYYKEGETVEWKIGDGYECNSNRILAPRKDEQGIIPGTDYWKDPTKNPGDKQFELTSKYERTEGTNLLIYSSINDNYHFTMTEVDHVDFHVQLKLKPNSVTVYNEDGTVHIDSSKYNIDTLPDKFKIDTIKDVTFTMDHQSVIDAFNKCPDHSGLDFTFAEDISRYIQAEAVNQKFEAQKNLVNENSESMDLGDREFEFELIYVSGPGKEGNEHISLGKVKNDADGNVSFGDQEFSRSGTYTYWIKEVTDNPINGIEYDKGYIEVTVTVVYDGLDSDTNKIKLEVDTVSYQKFKYDGNGNSMADSEKDDGIKQFTNIFSPKYYTLPSAGGPGVYIYIISGAGFILAAAVMFYRKRRKEA